ncbi:armadillo-type protein [Ochromonadaceae sp. CCMP2298]|nr:armadillo-type protein [Ochromonadaceae sp. CCMP2298]|mmetsp:Transcript_8993/g.20280  ORF Transcript_8993/g.20280 Transcript_8993/m.20280 type:complete len:976 (+) Transcript_8993:213-3140(+)
MEDDLVGQTKAAIAALSSPTETTRANEWLVEFERSAAAWEVADFLVREEVGSYRFFGAKFLYSKLQRQYVQLDASSGAMLTQSIVGHILRLSQEPTVELNVCRYLCLALATLALQMNQSGILQQILQWLNPIITTCPSVLLELLIVLPEEAYNHSVDVPASTRNYFIQQLSDSAGDVLNFLASLWPSVPPPVQAKLLVCASKWIDTTHLPSSFIVPHPIYKHVLDQLRAQTPGEAFEAAVDATIVIIQRFQCRDPRVLETAIPAIVSLKGMWAGLLSRIGPARTAEDVDEEDLHTCRALCRIFTETAESCMDMFIAVGAAPMQQADIIGQLIECCKIEFDPSIGRIPLKFFYELAMMVKAPSDSPSSSQTDHFEDSSGPSSAERAALNAQYVPVYQCLLEIAMARMMLAPALLQDSGKISEEAGDLRAEWRETVLDCCYVLGGSKCMEILCWIIQQEAAAAAGGASWSKLESVLICIIMVAPFLSKDDSAYVPQVIQFASTLPDNMHHLRVTVIELFGRFSFWLEANPSYVAPVLGRLFRDLQSKCSAAAARAIMNVFRACSSHGNLPVQELHAAVVQMRLNAAQGGVEEGAPTITLESELLLLEAIVTVVSHMPSPESEQAFRAVAGPVLTALSGAIASVPPSATSADASLFVPFIDRITVIFQFYRCREPFAAEMFAGVLPLYQHIFTLCPAERVSEKACRCYKHSLRNLGRQFAPYLPLMSKHLADQFALTPCPAFLYGASTCVASFSLLDGGIHVPVLYQMLWQMSHSFFVHFPTLQAFEQKPDVVEEYYYLMAKALQYCPGPFVRSGAEAATVLQAAVQGLALRHREAQKGVLLFFERFVQLSSFWPVDKENRPDGEAVEKAALAQAAKAMVVQYAPGLMSATFQLLSGERPAYALDESNGCIADVLWYLKKKFPDEFVHWLSSLTQGLSPVAQRVAHSIALVEKLTGTKSLKEFSTMLERFEINCRRNV